MSVGLPSHLFQLGHNLLRILILELTVVFNRVLDVKKAAAGIVEVLIRALAQCCKLSTILTIGPAELTL